MSDSAVLARPSNNFDLSALNEAQRRAVEAIDGPVLVLAGAGTGKTRVLTTRLAYILATGRAFPAELLAVTFTNKAAREMRERLEAMIGRAAEGVWLGTFHALASRILRRHAEAVGLSPNFTILDTDDQLRLLKQILPAANIDERRWPARALLGADPALEGSRPRPRKGARRPMPATWPTVARSTLYRALPGASRDGERGRFRRFAAPQFDACSPATLDPCPTTSGAFATCWSTNTRTPTSRNICGCGCWRSSTSNLCCVGDDDQSIYSWRGAEIGNILRFESDFPGAMIVRLEENYRSTPRNPWPPPAG